jgi:sterol desaturase/sphingolipid hydroxylase (fatty acid hydroxylase superfamily)
MDQLSAQHLIRILQGVEVNAAQYLVIVSAVFSVAWLWRWSGTRRFRIRSLAPRPPQLLREVLNSIRSVVVFAIVTFAVGSALRALFPSVYSHREALSFVTSPTWWMVAASIVVGLLLHDTYFYWTHRLLHSGWLFRRWHAEHHKSHNPSAWTAYSFSVPEAAVQGLFIPLYFFAVPVPHGAGVPFVAVALVINALGHCGIEFTPRVAVSHRWLGWLTGAVHHDIHHARSCSNYGLYFRFWDRLMGTEDPAFLAVYEFVRSPDNDGMGYRRFLGPRRREQPRDGVDGA